MAVGWGSALGSPVGPSPGPWSGAGVGAAVSSSPPVSFVSLSFFFGFSAFGCAGVGAMFVGVGAAVVGVGVAVGSSVGVGKTTSSKFRTSFGSSAPSVGVGEGTAVGCSVTVAVGGAKARSSGAADCWADASTASASLALSASAMAPVSPTNAVVAVPAKTWRDRAPGLARLGREEGEVMAHIPVSLIGQLAARLCTLCPH